MQGYKIITVDSLCEAKGEDWLNTILSYYSCPLNADIEDFLRHKALTFSKQSLAKTHVVFASYKNEYVIVGYFALANKTLFVPDKAKIGKNLKRRLLKFATRVDETKMSYISAPLIAQLGKNYTNGYDKLIRGDELLEMACTEIRKIQLSIGGKTAYLECEDNPKLLQFYENNGFRQFSERLDSNGSKLVQMIRYFSD